MGTVTVLADHRQARELTTKVYDCGKCHEQAARLDGNGNIMCGGSVDGVDCTARWAIEWYEPTDSKTKGKYTRPRLKVKDGVNVYCCGTCLFPFFHIQSDGSITCYREACKCKALFRWSWLEGVRG
jgi:hypothetical protein